MKNDVVIRNNFINELLLKARDKIKDSNHLPISPVELRKEYFKAFEYYKTAYFASCREKSIFSEMAKHGFKLANYNVCFYTFKEDNYYIECPLFLSRLKGISIGAQFEYKCSICGKELLDCNHIAGQLYDNVVCTKENEICNICLKNNCNHIIGETYNSVEALNNVTKMAFDHIALVSNPELPDTGIMSMQIDRKFISYRALFEHKNFIWGDDISCIYCLVNYNF